MTLIQRLTVFTSWAKLRSYEISFFSFFTIFWWHFSNQIWIEVLLIMYWSLGTLQCTETLRYIFNMMIDYVLVPGDTETLWYVFNMIRAIRWSKTIKWCRVITWCRAMAWCRAIRWSRAITWCRAITGCRVIIWSRANTWCRAIAWCRAKMKD